MFKRKNRVPREVRFDKSFLFSTPLFAIRVKKNNLLLNRFAVVVPKKIDKRAVVRNKIKRTTRLIVEDLQKNIRLGNDILLIAKGGILEKTKEEIKESLEETLIKI